METAYRGWHPTPTRAPHRTPAPGCATERPSHRATERPSDRASEPPSQSRPSHRATEPPSKSRSSRAQWGLVHVRVTVVVSGREVVRRSREYLSVHTGGPAPLAHTP